MREESKRGMKRAVAMSAGLVMGLLGAFGLGVVAQAADEIVVVQEPGLKPYKIIHGSLVPESLTGKVGDWRRGRELMASRKKGNCLACHRVQQMMEFPFHGNVGPELSDIALRMTEAEMRLRLINPKVVNPDTIMPAFYRTKGLHRVAKKFQGKPVLNEQEIEDIIAYMRKLYMVVR